MLTLADDRGMLGPDRLVPVVRRDLLRELSAAARSACARCSTACRA